MRERGGLPFILKGVQTAEGRRNSDRTRCRHHLCVEPRRAAADHGDSTLEILKRWLGVAKGKAEIVVDGGIVRGHRCAESACRGRRRGSAWTFSGLGPGAGGQATLVRALEIMEAEIKNAMGLTGVATLDELDASYVKEARAVSQSHELSAFPFLPEEIRGPQ